MAPPPPELIIDVVTEILLRLPPSEPERLFRAAVVSKLWLRTISDAAFLRRYRAFHGTPPLLGLIDTPDRRTRRSSSFGIFPTRAAPAPAPAFPLHTPDTRLGLPVDCRHRRVLIAMGEGWRVDYLVYEPVTGVRHLLPRYAGGGVGTINSAAAVFCAAAGCNHLDCHGGPFCVVLMLGDASSAIVAPVYSSEIGAWSEPALLPGIPEIRCCGRGALIGDEIYFMLSGSTGIVEYDCGRHRLSRVNPPPPAAVHNNQVTLMVMEDSSLGLAGVKHSSLYLWSRRVSSEETAEWVQCRVIDLEKMLPTAELSDGAYAVGSAEGVDVIFVSTSVGLFMIELKSEQARKVRKPNHRLSILPYMGFYTPRSS